jgi:5-hydroxyisourate hydrolase
MMSRISTHVLDTARGRPAAGVTVVLEAATPDGHWTEVARGVTDADGRVPDLSQGDAVGAGEYRLRFATGDYFRALGGEPFYPEVAVHVRLDGPSARYHLPLLLSPFGYSTYRGS